MGEEPATTPSLGLRCVRASVWLYRAALAPYLGNRCRFEPSCSAYAEEAVAVHGFWSGLFLAARRIVRCHPYSRGGLDPVPPGR